MSTNYGDTNYFTVVICSGDPSGSVGSETPNTSSGHTFYFVTVDTTIMDRFLQKIKETAGGNSYSTKDGKKTHEIRLGDCYIVKYSAYTKNTEAFDAIRDQLLTLHRSGSNPLYLFVYNNIDLMYVTLSQNSSGQATKYMKGYITSMDWNLSSGGLYYLRNFQWKECLT